MSEAFTLDTSGHVRRPGFARPLSWADLDPFERGYIEAAFAGSPDLRGDGSETRDAGFADLAPETLAAMLKDCEAFAERFGATKGEAGRINGGAFAKDRARYGFPPVTLSVGQDGLIYQREASRG